MAEVDTLLRAFDRSDFGDDARPLPAVQEPPAGKATLLPPCGAIESMQAMQAAGVEARTVVLDPLYRAKSGQGRAAYLAEMIPLMDFAGRLGQHVFVWGHPEHVGRLVDHWPPNLVFRAWLTWYFRNAMNRGKGWRPAQQACLHLSRRGATMYPEHAWSERQRKAAAENKLVYKLSPYSVLEGPLLSGFIDRTQQTGYPMQKPKVVIQPLLQMTCKPGDLVIDPTCGSGTTGEVAAEMGARAILADRSARAIQVSRRRLEGKGLYWQGES